MKTNLPSLKMYVSTALAVLALAAGVPAHAQVPPQIIKQAQGMIVSPGSTVTLTVEATGDPPLSFRWRRNAITLLPIGTNNSLAISNLRTGAVYSVIVTNLYGRTISSNTPVSCFTLNRTPQGNVLDLNVGTNYVYELQYLTDVTSTNWIGLTNFFLQTNVFRFVDTDATNDPQRFYRAVVQP